MIGKSLSSAQRAAGTAPAEWDLLLAATSAAPREADFARIRQALDQQGGQNPIDWDALLRLADRHGMSPLLYQNLAPFGGTIPQATLQSLRQSYERNVHKSLLLARELARILDHLDALGIEAIPYKGIVLSEAYYGDMALRPAGDIDLFIRRGDVGRAKNALRELGYAVRGQIPQNAEEDYIAMGYEYAFESPAGENLLEVQWALQPRFYAVDFKMDELFERAVNATVGGRHVRMLCAEDLLIVLALHAAKHVWGRMIWLCDIAQILKRETLDWGSVQSQAREYGIQRILHITLLLANRFPATVIPAAMGAAIAGDQAAKAFADEIAVAVGSGVSYEKEPMAYFRLMMRLRERRADRLRFLTRLALTPGPGEWETVHLPKTLFPLYRVVRLARLVGKSTQWLGG